MTAPVTLPVDAEKVLIDWLRPIVDPLGVPIDVRGAGPRFVRVRRIGGVELSPNHDQPTCDVIVWHDDDAARMSLALQLWQRIRSAAGDVIGNGVITYSSTMLGPRQMPDPADDTKSVCIFTSSLIVRPATPTYGYGHGPYGHGPYGGTPS